MRESVPLYAGCQRADGIPGNTFQLRCHLVEIITARTEQKR